MASRGPVVTKESDIWVLRLLMPSGKVQEYRCATEGQAQALAALLSRPPDAVPAGAAARL